MNKLALALTAAAGMATGMASCDLNETPYIGTCQDVRSTGRMIAEHKEAMSSVADAVDLCIGNMPCVLVTQPALDEKKGVACDDKNGQRVLFTSCGDVQKGNLGDLPVTIEDGENVCHAGFDSCLTATEFMQFVTKYKESTLDLEQAQNGCAALETSCAPDVLVNPGYVCLGADGNVQIFSCDEVQDGVPSTLAGINPAELDCTGTVDIDN